MKSKLRKDFVRWMSCLLFALVFLPQEVQAGCSWSYSCSNWGTCSYCADTCNRCVNYTVQDPEYPKNVVNLPLNFNYQKADDKSSNDSCSSSACGTKNCKAPTTTFSANQLPVAPGACILDPNDRIPSSLNCKYKDGACVTYCSKTVSYSCCTSGSWTKTCD